MEPGESVVVLCFWNLDGVVGICGLCMLFHAVVHHINTNRSELICIDVGYFYERLNWPIHWVGSIPFAFPCDCSIPVHLLCSKQHVVLNGI